mgnify:CR=1 FL=1
MMVQMVDTVSWISALIHEAKSWRGYTGVGRESDNMFTNRSASHRDNTVEKTCRIERFGDV